MNNFQRVRAWLEAPEVFGEETLRQVSFFNQIFKWGVVFLVATLMVYPFAANARNATQYLSISLILLGGLFVSKLMLNRGWISVAGYLITMVFWLTFVGAALLSPDRMASTSFLAAVTIAPILAGFIHGTKASVLVTLLNWGVGAYLTWLDVTDITRNVAYYEEPLFRYFALMIMVSVFPLIVYVWHRNLHDTVASVRLSQQAQAETAAYRRQNVALEEAVTTRTSALEESLVREQQMAEKLALALESETQLGELQSRIITVVSHEFRTPLAVINSSSELLQQFYDRLSEERREAAHRRISESVFYLHDLLKDVTMVDKAQRAMIRPSYKTYPFSDLCQKLTQQLLREVNDAKRINFRFASNLENPIQTDLTLLKQVMANLISNSLKYSENDTEVQVHFSLDSTELFIEVQDQGIGVPVHEQARIFELFYRASNVDERRGLGLGLFIVQAISQMMQGTVCLHSGGEGQGALVEVRFPVIPNLD
jgi:signal transduction histidine kinase